MQKKVHLSKPFTVCTTDGYIVDMLSKKYLTNENVAMIIKEIKHSRGLCRLIKPDDIFVLDREAVPESEKII